MLVIYLLAKSVKNCCCNWLMLLGMQIDCDEVTLMNMTVDM
ncbi:hypothetical protein [Moritella viscosa]|uniref:Uncharacterized protein n=1 Tax=Moritella viscosa TaxID=80854 RepID=A0ABY1H9Y2_9GAMM|nr:hypothetical protein [Moritella viscosa]SGY81422.1 Putative uncharacterized protein [Moritella viscosa]SGY81617.1 Putative uncharacterized protein [Moritella viscosa]SHO24005.1 Putative uncharacterized protein [Moritella viscosa]